MRSASSQDHRPVAARDARPRDGGLDAGELAFLSGLLRDACGVVLTRAKGAMVQSRLSRRARALRLGGVGDYVRRLRADAGFADSERQELVNALTTHHTGFFREAHHFEVLEREVLPGLLAGRTRRLRLWSAACASGEEAYSLAAVLHGALARHPGADARILATDIDDAMIAQAQAGLYPAAALARLPERRRRALVAEPCTPGDQVRIGAALRQRISFRALNLLGPWPFAGPFDVIMCRNVMIYFDQATKQQLADRFAGVLAPGGVLVIGHSESLQPMPAGFVRAGRTIYRRRATASVTSHHVPQESP